MGDEFRPTMLPPHPYQLSVVARTGPGIGSFGPYVPAVGDSGEIAFQFARENGSTGLARVLGRDWFELEAPAGLGAYVSHPAIQGLSVVAYATDEQGHTGLALHGRSGARFWPAEALGALDIGPLGPTFAKMGAALVRGRVETGPALFVVPPSRAARVYPCPPGVEVQGLPIAWPDWRPMARFDWPDGSQTWAEWGEQGWRPLLRAEGGADRLGNFPHALGGWACLAGHDGQGPYVAVRAAGGSDRRIPLPWLESVRGALLSDRHLIVYGTAPGEALSVYWHWKKRWARLFGIGDETFGAPIEEFALNPVSINRAGQFAARAKLVDGVEIVLRGDPSA